MTSEVVETRNGEMNECKSIHEFTRGAAIETKLVANVEL